MSTAQAAPPDTLACTVEEALTAMRTNFTLPAKGPASSSLSAIEFKPLLLLILIERIIVRPICFPKG